MIVINFRMIIEKSCSRVCVHHCHAIPWAKSTAAVADYNKIPGPCIRKDFPWYCCYRAWHSKNILSTYREFDDEIFDVIIPMIQQRLTNIISICNLQYSQQSSLHQEIKSLLNV